MRIQNVSVDLWGTIIRSNPRFKNERATFIKNKYKLSASSNEIEVTIEKTGELFDQLDSQKGNCCSSSEERYQAAYTNLGIQWNKQDFGIFDEIFLDHLPMYYDSNTYVALKRLKERVKTLTLMSNTGYVDSHLMLEGIKRIGLEGFFDHMLFSDKIGVSKPNREIFDEWARKTSDTELVNPKIYLHVGDNKLCDYEGPTRLGMEGFLINGKTGRNIKSVITFLDGKL